MISDAHRKVVDYVLGENDSILTLARSNMAPCEKHLFESLEFIADSITNKKFTLEDKDTLWSHLRTLCLSHYWSYLRIVLQLRFLDPWWHGEEICKFLDDTEGMDRIIMLPRGTGKTTVVSTPIVPWMLAKDPMLLTATINAREERAGDIARAQADIIANSHRFRNAFPYLIPSDHWGRRGYRLQNRDSLDIEGSSERVDSAISSFGVGGNLTGSHLSMLIVDDIINQKMAESANELSKAEDFFLESLNCLESNDSLVIVNCTRWHMNDLYGKIEKGEIKSHKGRFAVLRRGILNKEGELVWPKRVYIDLRGKARESGWTKEQLENIKFNYERKGKLHLFSSLYFNKPVHGGNLDFDFDLIGRYESLPFVPGRVSCIGVEVGGGGRAILSSVKVAFRDEGIGVAVLPLQTRKLEKTIRIKASLGTVCNSGRLQIPEEHWRGDHSLGEEMRNFPKGADDMLDAVSHAIINAQKNDKSENPLVYIAIDPAYSNTNDADSTAICAGCWYKDQFWMLDGRKFKTERPDLIGRMVVRMYNKYNNYERSEKDMGLNYQGFSGHRYSKSSGNFFGKGGFFVDKKTLFEEN